MDTSELLRQLNKIGRSAEVIGCLTSSTMIQFGDGKRRNDFAEWHNYA